MPEGKGYRRAKEIQAMRDEGVFSPSEIIDLEKIGRASCRERVSSPV